MVFIFRSEHTMSIVHFDNCDRGVAMGYGIVILLLGCDDYFDVYFLLCVLL